MCSSARVSFLYVVRLPAPLAFNVKWHVLPRLLCGSSGGKANLQRKNCSHFSGIPLSARLGNGLCFSYLCPNSLSYDRNDCNLHTCIAFRLRFHALLIRAKLPQLTFMAFGPLIMASIPERSGVLKRRCNCNNCNTTGMGRASSRPRVPGTVSRLTTGAPQDARELQTDCSSLRLKGSFLGYFPGSKKEFFGFLGLFKPLK